VKVNEDNNIEDSNIEILGTPLSSGYSYFMIKILMSEVLIFYLTSLILARSQDTISVETSKHYSVE